MLPTRNPLQGRFNGVIQTDEGPVTVKDGFAVIDGELYMVSDDGVLVTDKNGKVVSVVINKKAMPLTPEIINQLRAAGYVK